jgi:hypothetical protein
MIKIRCETCKEFSAEIITKQSAMLRIKEELEILKADNIVVEKDRIAFKNNPNKWGNKNSLMTILDEGAITFSQTDKKLNVHFIGYYSNLVEIMLYIVSGGLLAIMINAWIALICIHGIILVFLKISNIKDKCNDLISKIGESVHSDM